MSTKLKTTLCISNTYCGTKGVRGCDNETRRCIRLDAAIAATSPLCRNVTVSETDISKTVFGRHVSWERPLINARKPIDIEIRLVLSSINNVVEKDKVLKLSGYLLFYWYDEFHVWNATFPQACLDSVVLPRKNVWIPEIALINSEQHYELLYTHYDEKVRAYSSGYMSYRPGGTFEVYCDYDLTYFPFDEQICTVTMESWRYTIEYQRFHFGDSIKFRYWIENEQWRLVNVSQRIYDVSYVNSNVFCRVEFVLKLSRKIGYYSINVIAPSVLISIAEIATFSLPVDEVLKIHVSFTCLLAYGVFQLMIIEDIPRTSDKIPLLCYYIFFSMLFICLAMLGEGLVFLCIRRCDDRRRNYYVSKNMLKFACAIGPLLRVRKPPILLFHVTKIQQNALLPTFRQPDKGNHYSSLKNYNHRPFLSLFDLASRDSISELQITDNDESNLEQNKADYARRQQWEYVAEVVDKLVLAIYMWCISVTPIVMFVILPSVSRVQM